MDLGKRSSHDNVVSNDSSNFSDEFLESIQYLDSLSKKQKEDKRMQDRHLMDANKTLKNRPSTVNSSPMYGNTVEVLTDPYSHNAANPYVQLELPEDMKNAEGNSNISNNVSQIAAIPTKMSPHTEDMSSFKLNYRIDDSIPHGCLKGGIKPTYRNLYGLQTRKNTSSYNAMSDHAQVNDTTYASSTSDASELNQPYPHTLGNPVAATVNNYIDTPGDRQRKLELLRNKIKTQQQHVVSSAENIQPIILSVNTHNNNIPPTQIITEQQTVGGPQHSGISSALKQKQPTIAKIKRTIRRKYTLGKSHLKQQVSILIKDHNTRKQIMHAHRDLKRVSINDVKKYLRDHGLMRVGSLAPNNVIRKTYESAILTGEVHNNNQDTLLHNFLQDTSSS